MAGDKFDSSGPLYAVKGEVLLSAISPDVDRIVLYVEARDAWYSISEYQEHKYVVEYNNDEPQTLFKTIEAARESEEISLRWTTMEYEVSGGSFTAKLGNEPLLEGDGLVDRRDLVLKRYFGDKPVHYDQSIFE